MFASGTRKEQLIEKFDSKQECRLAPDIKLKDEESFSALGKVFTNNEDESKIFVINMF